MTHSSPITLDHIRAWSSRRKLIEGDLKDATEETRIRWATLMMLLVTKRAEKHGVRESPKELAPDLILDEPEKGEAVAWLSDRFASEWRLYQPAVRRALDRLREERGASFRALKRQALRPAIIEALHDADEEQVTQIGRDRAWGHGSRLVQLQKQDLKEVAKKGLTDELVQKLSARPAGLRVFPSDGVLSPIEAVFLREDLEPDRVRPLELRPCLLLQWVRTRALKLAKKRLLEEAGLDPDDAPDSMREVEVRDPNSDPNGEPANHEEVSPRELLEALDREDPDPLAPIIAVEQRQVLKESATPRQMEYLAAVSKKWAQGMNEAQAIKAVANEKGKRPNTVHKNLQRLRDRAADHFSDDGCQVPPTCEDM